MRPVLIFLFTLSSSARDLGDLARVLAHQGGYQLRVDERLEGRQTDFESKNLSPLRALSTLVRQESLRLGIDGTGLVLLPEPDSMGGGPVVNLRLEKTPMPIVLQAIFSVLKADCILHHNLSSILVTASFRDTPALEALGILIQLHGLKVVQRGEIYAVKAIN